MQTTIEQQLKDLHTKLHVLLKQYKLLQKENEQLKKEIATLKSNAVNNEKLANSLQQALDAGSIAKQQTSNTDKLALEKRIDKYLQEIDKCLLLLNAQA